MITLSNLSLDFSDKKLFENVEMQVLETDIKEGNANVIDCREVYEYEEGHIPGSINMPTSDFLSHIDKINKETHYYVICLTGARSQMVARYLGNQGYQVSNVYGGMVMYHGEIE